MFKKPFVLLVIWYAVPFSLRSFHLCSRFSHQPLFGPFHERLSVVTHYYFNQKNFSNTEILESLYNSLVASYSPEKPLIIPDILVGSILLITAIFMLTMV